MTNVQMFWTIVVLLIVALAVIAGIRVAMGRAQLQRRAMLRERFGPEYDRAFETYGRRTDSVLADRMKRVEHTRLRALSTADRARFSAEWDRIQVQFVDDPRVAVIRANELIKEVMRVRGYSADEGFDQRTADLSVDHPDVVQHYRAARALAQSAGDETTSTEDLRQAVVHYRVLFADLLQETAGPPGTFRPAHA